jgi:hypothetical protein
MSKQPVITWNKVWRGGRMWQYLPAPIHCNRFCTSQWQWGVALSWSKWHNAQAVMVDYSEQPASPYPVRVGSNTGLWMSYQLAQDGQSQIHFSWRTWSAWLSEHPHSGMQFFSSVTLGHTIQHSVISAEGKMSASNDSTIKMWSRKAMLSFL